MSDIWQQFNYFPSSVYILEKPEFMENIKTVVYDNLENLKKEQKMDEIYPIFQTNNIFHDNRIINFTSYVAQTAWNIMNHEGYNMENKETYFTEMWSHYYYRYGSMERHIHAGGSYITGFYILEVPEKSSKIVLHDPRPGKVQINFDHNMKEDIYNSTETIYINPFPGMLFFSNSWLPHSFTRNENNEPFIFIHFNLGIKSYCPPPPPPAEII